MDAFQTYILQNWILILLLAAFAIVLATTGFVDKKATRRLYVLLGFVFLLSISVFLEFYYEDESSFRTARTVLMAIRYSATPLIIAQIIYALIKKQKAYVFIPAGVLLVIDIVSIFTGIVFEVNENNDLERGPLGYLPFIVAGLYCAYLIYLLVVRSNKRMLEIIPIVFLGVAFASGLIFPFIFGPNFAQIFCTTVALSLFIFYVFSILQLTKKDALTGLLNRQAYYSEAGRLFNDITAVVSIDMNGLKKINDTYGHNAGDEALITLGLCISKSCRRKESAYRMGGDEFAIVCRKTTELEVVKLIERLNKHIGETKYSASIGYCYQKDGSLGIDDLLKKSDEKMYISKSEFYKNNPK